VTACFIVVVGAEAGEAEHREGDESVGGVEGEGAAGDQSDLGVDRFDARVAQLVFDRADDPGAS
jgi:hypothetical protein